MTLSILILGFAAGLYMAWNIGANDVANGMASAVGAKAITLRQAVFIAGILDCLLAALLAASFWVFFATWRQLPVSTTHSVVGAMIGFGLITGGLSVIRWTKVMLIVLSWIISPFFASLLAFLMFRFIRNRILSRPDMFVKALRWSPFFVGLTFFIIALSLMLKTPLGSRLGIGLGNGLLMSFVIAAVMGGIGRWTVEKTVLKRGEEGVEEIFRRLQVLTSCYVALAHGANDVANAMGPLAGIYIIYMTQGVSPEVPVPFLLLAFGGFGIALGVVTWGHRVIETVGTKITTLTNTRGFAVDFGTATCVLIASKLGLPVSTTHAAVGAVVGVGLARGVDAVDFRVVWKICLYWVITLPVAALTCMMIYKFLEAVFA